MKKYKVNNKYIVVAKNRDHAIQLVKTLKDKKPTDYAALCKQLERKFHTEFNPDPKFNAIEAPEVWGDDKLDRAIVNYLKSLGYKIEFDGVDDAGYYNFIDSVSVDSVRPRRHTARRRIDSVKDKKPTDIKALCKQLERKFHTEFNEFGDDAIEAPEVWGDDNLDRKITNYLKSLGYKIMFDGIDDAGLYNFMDSVSRDDVFTEDDEDDIIDINMLTAEEQKAIADYKKAIAKTKDPQLLKLFGHILKEEVEHLEELENEEVEDSIKR